MVVTSDGFVTLPPGPRRGGGGLPFVGSGAEGLGAALAGLGGAVGEITDPNRGLREAIITKAFTDPEFAAELARAQRRAEQQALPGIADARTGVSVPNVLEGAGFSIEATRAITNLSPATGEELAAPLEAEVKRTELSQKLDSLRAFGMLGGPVQAATAEVAESGAKIQEAKLRGETARVKLLKDLPALEAGLQQIELQLGTQAVEEVSNFFNDEDLSDEDKLKLSLALAGPNSQAFLRELQLRDEREAAKVLAQIRAQGAAAVDPVKRIKLKLEVGRDIANAIGQIENIEDDDARELLYVRIAMLAQIQAEVAPESVGFDSILKTTGLFGGGRELEVKVQKLSPIVQKVWFGHVGEAGVRGADAILAGDPAFATIIEEAGLTEEFKQAAKDYDTELKRLAGELPEEEKRPPATPQGAIGTGLMGGSISSFQLGKLLALTEEEFRLFGEDISNIAGAVGGAIGEGARGIQAGRTSTGGR